MVRGVFLKSPFLDISRWEWGKSQRLKSNKCKAPVVVSLGHRLGFCAHGHCWPWTLFCGLARDSPSQLLLPGQHGLCFGSWPLPLLLRICFFRDLDMPNEIPELIFRSGCCLVLSPLCSVPLIQVLFRFSVYFTRGDLSFPLSKFLRDVLLQSSNFQPSPTVGILHLFSRLWRCLHTGLLMHWRPPTSSLL